MFRYLLLLLIALAPVVRSMAATASGAWNAFPISGEFTQILDTDKTLWYVTGGMLNSYDKSADETRTYTMGNGLSSYDIRHIYHNPERGYLAVAYENANIDLIFDDGTVNLPDIKDATISIDKGINDIVFHGNLIYVATDFGLVIFNEERREVVESGIYNNCPIKALCALEEGVVLIPAEKSAMGNSVLFHRYGEHINKYENFGQLRKPGEIGELSNLVKLSDNSFAATLYYNIHKFTVEPGGKRMNSGVIGTGITHSLMPAKNGGIYYYRTTDGGIYSSKEGEAAVMVSKLPDILKNDVIITYEGPETSLWAGNDAGLGKYRLGADGSVTVLRDKSLPDDATTFSQVCKIFPGAGNSFIITNLGMNIGHPVGGGDRFDLPMYANYISDNTITDINPEISTYSTSTGSNYSKRVGNFVLSPTGAAQDPDYAERFYFTSAVEGLYVTENGTEVAHFDETNSPLRKHGGVYRSTDVQIDHLGNLWVAINIINDACAKVCILPAAKRKNKDLKGITEADWVVADFGGKVANKDLRLLICRHSNYVFLFDSAYDPQFEVLQHNGDPTDVKGHKHITWDKLNDTDGNPCDHHYWFAAAEDERGQVWLGNDGGVYCIPNPAAAMQSNFAITKVKVPRNDGTNLADYLLETSQILAIEIDHSNRKWIATAESGLYLVSENGDEILANYNTSNSPLPSNAICDIFVDPQSNLLYIATLQGLFSLSTTSSPAMPDFKEVYAYPNPVTPEFSGWITITGLMDNSLVKIVDSGMHLVYQTTSEGGMATWDGCNLNGQRVRSGVYYVIASTGSDDSSSSSEAAVATKILVVN